VKRPGCAQAMARSMSSVSRPGRLRSYVIARGKRCAVSGSAELPERAAPFNMSPSSSRRAPSAVPMPAVFSSKMRSEVGGRFFRRLLDGLHRKPRGLVGPAQSSQRRDARPRNQRRARFHEIAHRETPGSSECAALAVVPEIDQNNLVNDERAEAESFATRAKGRASTSAIRAGRRPHARAGRENLQALQPSFCADSSALRMAAGDRGVNPMRACRPSMWARWFRLRFGAIFVFRIESMTFVRGVQAFP